MRLLAFALALSLGIATWFLTRPAGAVSGASVPSPEPAAQPTTEPSSVSLADVAPRAAADEPEARTDATESIADQSALASRAMLAKPIPANRAGLLVRVVGDGGPLEGIVVTVDKRVKPRYAGDAPEDALDDAPIRTDVRGEARFFVLPMRTVAVQATPDDGSSVASTSLTSPRDGDQRDVELKLAVAVNARSATLLVLDEKDRTPVAGVEILVRTTDGTRLRTKTGDNGTSMVPARLHSEILLEKDGYQDHTVEMSTQSTAAPIEILLRRPARVHGTIAGWEDGPAAHVSGRVTLYKPFDFNADLSTPLPTTRQFRADVRRDGSWAIDPLEISYGTSELEGYAVMLTEHRTAARRELGYLPRIAPSETYEIHDPWAGSPPLTLSFQHADGAPIGDRTPVRFRREGEPEPASGRGLSQQIATDGTVAFPSLPEGRWQWEISAPLRTSNPLISGVIGHDGTPAATVTLTGFAPITGKVVGTGEAPHSAHQITLHLGGQQTLVRYLEGVQFRCDLVPEGLPADVVLDHVTHEFDEAAGTMRSNRVELDRQQVTDGSRNVVLTAR